MIVGVFFHTRAKNRLTLSKNGVIMNTLGKRISNKKRKSLNDITDFPPISLYHILSKIRSLFIILVLTRKD